MVIGEVCKCEGTKQFEDVYYFAHIWISITSATYSILVF